MARRRVLSRFTALAVAGVVAVATLVSVPALTGNVTAALAAGGTLFIDDPLTNQATLNTDWIVKGSKKIQANGAAWTPQIQTIAQTIPQTGGGNNNPITLNVNADRDDPWLTLTTDFTPTSNSMSSGQPTGDGQAGFVLNRQEFSSEQGVVMEYDQRMWRTWPGLIAGNVSTDANQQYEAGSGVNAARFGLGAGDGLSLMLVDAAAYEGKTDSGIFPGAYGAGLGYSSAAGRSSNGNTLLASLDQEQGVAGGYLGVGFDVHGNYANYTSWPNLNATGGTTRPPLFTGQAWGAQTMTGLAPANGQIANGTTRSSSRSPSTIGVRGSGHQYTDLWGNWAATAITGNTVTNPGDFNRNYGLSGGEPAASGANGGYLWQDGAAQLLPMTGAALPNPAYQTGTTIFFKPDPGSGSGRWSGATSILYKIGSGAWLANPVPMNAVVIGGETWYWYTVGTNYENVQFTFRETGGGQQWFGTDFNVSDGGAWTVIPEVNRLDNAGNRAYPGPANTNYYAFQNQYRNANMYNRVKVSITPEAGGQHRVQVSLSQPLNVNNDTCEGSSGGGDLHCFFEGPIQYTQILDYTMGGGNSQYQAALPDQFMIGFGASTGWAINYHQIRNVVTAPIADPMITKTIAVGTYPDGSAYVDHVTPQVGQTISYALELQNNGPSDLGQDYPVDVTDGLSSLPVSPVSWRAEAVADRGGGFRYWIESDSVWSEWVTAGNTAQGAGALPAMQWYAPANAAVDTPAVVVGIAATVLPEAGLTTWVNTATITPATGGPGDSDLTNNSDTASFVATAAPIWRVSKGSDPESGSVVAGGSEIKYTVTATVDQNLVTPSVTTIYYKPPSGWVLPTGTSVMVQTQSRPLGSGGAWSSSWAVQTMTKVPGSDPIPGYSNDGTWWKAVYASSDELRAYFYSSGNPWDAALNNNVEVGYFFNQGIGNYTLLGVMRGVTPNAPAFTAATPGPVTNNTVTNATLYDDLSEVLQYAGIVVDPSNVEVTLTDVAGPLPECSNAPALPCYVFDELSSLLEVRNVTITASSAAEVSRSISYRVLVNSDVAANVSFKNVATGNSANVPPQTCPADGSVTAGDPLFAECWTEHFTPDEVIIQVLKVGENDQGTVIPFSGSEWAIYGDDSGAPDYADVIVEFGPVPKTPQVTTGLFQTEIAPGTYWLREEKALEGFNLLPEPVQFTVATSGAITLAAGNSIFLTACPASPTGALCPLIPTTPVDYSGNPTIVVSDIPILDLPEAGGTTEPFPYYLGGLSLLLLAAAVGFTTIALRRRARADSPSISE